MLTRHDKPPPIPLCFKTLPILLVELFVISA